MNVVTIVSTAFCPQAAVTIAVLWTRVVAHSIIMPDKVDGTTMIVGAALLLAAFLAGEQIGHAQAAVFAMRDDAKNHYAATLARINSGLGRAAPGTAGAEDQDIGVKMVHLSSDQRKRRAGAPPAGKSSGSRCPA